MSNRTKRVFLVFGLPRSGTSLVAHILHTLNVSMGERLKRNTAWCRDGLYEDLEFDDLVKTLINDTNTRCIGGKLLKTDRPDVIDSLWSLVQSRNVMHNEWGVKNLLMPWIMQSFEQWCQPAELSLVRCWREPHEAIESYAARTGENIFSAAQEAGVQLLIAGKGYAMHDGPKITVDYAHLLAEPALCTQMLADFVGLPWTEAAALCVDRTQRRFGVREAG